MSRDGWKEPEGTSSRERLQNSSSGVAKEVTRRPPESDNKVPPLKKIPQLSAEEIITEKSPNEEVSSYRSGMEETHHRSSSKTASLFKEESKEKILAHKKQVKHRSKRSIGQSSGLQRSRLTSSYEEDLEEEEGGYEGGPKAKTIVSAIKEEDEEGFDPVTIREDQSFKNEPISGDIFNNPSSRGSKAALGSAMFSSGKTTTER